MNRILIRPRQTRRVFQFVRLLTLTSLAGGLLWNCTPPGPRGCFPAEHLPDHIQPLTDFGQRAEWARDGNSVFFVDSAGGDVWQVDVKSKKVKMITRPEYREPGEGYYRVLCLTSGDLLLTVGPERYTLHFQVMDGDLNSPPVNIPGEVINEGPAVSKNTMRIAWSPEHRRIFTGEISLQNGSPEIVNKRLLIDSGSVVVEGTAYTHILEPQDFRPPDDRELIWSQYGHTSEGVFSSEVIGLDLETGELVNYSRAPEQYDEPEGIFPDGIHTLIESDRHNPGGTAFIEVYRITLDPDNPDYQRLTYFSEVEGFRASNPVVSPDGHRIAFQASLSGSAPGAGCGLYLLDLKED